MITASLVLYNSDPSTFGVAISSFLESSQTGQIWISDNSPIPTKNELFDHPRVHYSFNDGNVGFGRGHNLAIAKISALSKIHLILNPDISFSVAVLPYLESVFVSSPEIGAVMPQICYPDGTLQRLAKLLPTPLDLILRRFLPFTVFRQHLNKRYELHDLRQDQNVEVPSISGCFLLVRTDILHRISGFDPRYFMYMEDVDLVRRISNHGTIMYVPATIVTHNYAKGSYKNAKLLKYHIQSALKYFNKWGWLYDSKRTVQNSKILSIVNKRK